MTSDTAGASQDPARARQDAGSPLKGEVSGLQGLVEELRGRITDREIVIDLPADVLFDFDRAEIRSDAIPTLRTLAALIRQAGHGTIHVTGHTDSIGDEAYNESLSTRRAAAVAEWLATEGGVDGGRFETRGYGERQPVAPNAHPDGSDNPGGRQQNRRVEVRVPR